MLRLTRAVTLLAVLFSLNGCGNEPTTGVGDKVGGIPEGWEVFPDSTGQVGLTTQFRHRGSHALSITGRVYANINQSILATNYRGQRVRWSGWMMSADVANGITSGLWMRVDDGQTTLAFDNMVDRPFIGTNDWTPVSIVLDVPLNAVGITIGITFNAYGRLIVDDLALEVVGLDEPTTKPSAPFSFNTAQLYVNAPARPANLDFEGTIAGSIR